MFELIGDPQQIVDTEEGLIFSRVGGAYGQRIDQFFSYPKDGDGRPLTCEFAWSEATRLATEAERKELPPHVEFVTVYLVKAATGREPMNLPGKTKQETMHLVTEALLCRATMSRKYSGNHGKYRLVGKSAVTVQFSEQLQALMIQEN